jgi:glycosyltransferase involved in cell wall biosynthesis
LDILILHPNFPGQFRERLREFVQLGHRLTFICIYNYPAVPVQGVRIIQLFKSNHEAELHFGNRLSAIKVLEVTADLYGKAFTRLKDRGYDPDVVISHTGWGCGQAVSRVWPESLRIGYVEWWFKEDSMHRRFDAACEWQLFNHQKGNRLSTQQGMRNLAFLQEMVECKILVAPTAWQRMQLPSMLAERCIVIHDGANVEKIKPGESKSESPEKLVVTYATRGMEIVRGFPEFVSELPACLERFSDISVEIAAEDKIHYGGNPPAEGSWGAWCQKKLDKHISSGRVRMLGRLPYREYLSLLSSSWLHVYTTQPFVASWSLVEAMAAGCCLVASDVEPVREFLSRDDAFLVDHRRSGWLMASIRALHEQPQLRKRYSARARQRALSFSKGQARAAWQSLICH